MEKTYEVFKLGPEFPIKFYLRKISTILPHWHSNVEIVYILEGETSIITKDEIVILKEDDIFVNNAFCVHELRGSNCVLLSIHIDMLKLGVSESEQENICFDCNSSSDSNKTNYVKLKSIISSFVKYNLKFKNEKNYANMGIAYTLFAELTNKFSVESNLKRQSFKYSHRLKELTKYIELHYLENITLADLSIEFSLTVPYISSFFEKYMGSNFQKYYDNLRVEKTISPLLTTDLSIETIAFNAGFKEARSYVRAFRNVKTATPSEYRKLNYRHPKIDTENQMNFITFEKTKYLDKLIKDVEFNRIEQLTSVHRNSLSKIYEIDFNASTIPLKKTFLNFIGVGRAIDFLTAPARTMLEEIQRDIGFKYVKFHGILDDSMHVVKRYTDGLHYSFVFVDQVIDYILSLNLKPLIQLSFMPKALASQTNRKTYDNGIIISLPDDNNEFIDLIINFTNHLISRYGEKEVCSWPFTFWNAPDTSEHAFGFSDEQAFFELYTLVFKALKKITNKLRVGSPSLIPICDEMINFDTRFLDYAKAHQAYPDFLIVHYYSNDFSIFFSGNKAHEKFFTDADKMSKFIDLIKDKSFFSGEQVYLTEWNFTSSHRNLLSDTIYNSCYIVKNILENIDRLDSFGKWYLSDLIDETQIPDKMYHGGLGFYTFNGVKKSNYYAYKFLSLLDNDILQQDKGYFVTRSEKSIKVILYNYEHYSDLYAEGEYFELSEHNRYLPFKDNQMIRYQLIFKNLNFNECTCKETSIYKNSGSSYDILEDITSLEIKSKPEVEGLKGLSTPKFKIYKKELEDKTLNLTIDVNPLEVILIEINLK